MQRNRVDASRNPDYDRDMEKLQLHILGCGSATPTLRHFPSSQVLSLRGRNYMIDCGEGAQLQLRRCHLRFTTLDHIFISHLHGDHCFGLVGLISTFALHKRETPLHVYAPKGLKKIMEPLIAFFCSGIGFEVMFHEMSTDCMEEFAVDDWLKVTTLPLHHRVPTCGFLFREHGHLRHIRRDMMDYLQIPHYAIPGIRQGEGWTTGDGRCFANEQLTLPADPSRSYAYVSDTAFLPQLADALQGVDLLFHEATFAEADAARATETLHSTASQAARMAVAAKAGKLLIGHFSSRYDDETLLLKEAQAIFPDTTLAREMMVVDIQPKRV